MSTHITARRSGRKTWWTGAGIAGAAATAAAALLVGLVNPPFPGSAITPPSGVVGDNAIQAAPAGEAGRIVSVVDDGRDIAWYLSQGSGGYRDMLNAVRARARGGTLYNGVDSTTNNRDDIFTLNVRQLGNWGNPDVRVLITARDLYLQGYFVPATNTYYYFRGAPINRYNPTGNARQVQLPFRQTYADVEAYATGGATYNRRTPEMNNRNYDWAIEMVADPSGTAVVRAQATLVLSQAIAEAARFDVIGAALTRNFTNTATPHRMTATEIALENSWQALGNRFQQELRNGSATAPYPPIGEYVFTTLSGYAAVLALALLL